MKTHEYHYDVRRAGLIGVAVAILVLAACGGDNETLVPAATLPHGTTTNPYAVPAIIDEAYVNRVLAGLDQVFGDAVRIVVASRTFPADAAMSVEALYFGEVRQLVLDSVSLSTRAGLDSFERSPGNQITIVAGLLTANPACIFAEVSRDYSDVTRDDDPAVVQWVALERAEKFGSPSGHNPTGWVYVFDGVESDGTGPEDPCADS